MTSISEQFDRRSHPDNTPFVSNILWERGDDFDPDILNKVFEEKSLPFEHETFGQGNRWYLGFIGGMRTKLDFYSNNRILFITYNDSKDVAQERMYMVDAIGLGHVGNRRGVTFMSERDMKSEIVLVQTNGNFDEFHRRLVLLKQDLPMPAVQENAVMRKKILAAAPEQLQWLSKDPTQLTKTDIESLFKILSAKHKRLYDQQTRQTVNIASNLMVSLINIIDGHQLEEYETTAFDYLKLRFVQELKTKSVADKMGYTREYVSRAIRVKAMELLFKYARKLN